MWSRADPTDLLAFCCPPAIVTIGFYLLSLLPGEIILALAVWTLASFPIGMLIGRFVLSKN